ncbi:MAG: peptide-methionine (R)-S-oxide reductase MsrB [Spirochaetota bacterium]
MTKKTRVAVVISGLMAATVLIATIGPGPRALFAQGGGEGTADTSGADASGAAGSSGGTAVLGAEADEAVAIASQIPDEWDYDPRSRVIHREDAALEYPADIPDSSWRDLLTPNEFYILRQKGTEPAFSHPLNDVEERGIYYSAATGQPLFSSEDKYESGSGWPSFTKPISPNAIVYLEDNSLFARRIEVVDSLSGSHLGHVFSDGPPPTGQRYCMNGAALVFVPEGEEPPPIRVAAP